jgi:hypothetical protein
MAKKSPPVGTGARFAKLTAELRAKGKNKKSADAIAASIGRKKYGKAKFQKMAAAGR